jgi:hypothetical protein
MHTLQKNPSPTLPTLFMVVIVVVACLLALFFATRQSASKTLQPDPRSGLQDVAQEHFTPSRQDFRP